MVGTTPRFYLPIQDELEEVGKRLSEAARQETPGVGPFLGHALNIPGKRIRPAITLLASRFHPGPRDLPILMATAVEMLHLATLLHDDTVDNASFRRGRATLNQVWGPQVAVLVGDYAFAASAVLVCDTQNVRVIRRFAETIMELSSGELLERLSAYDWHQTRKQYLERIAAKTASLFCTASESGAILSGAPEETVQALRLYGFNVGMAFQVVDDILDFESRPEDVGKPVAQDLAQGTVTLPAIMLLERFPENNPLPKFFADVSGVEHLAQVLERIRNSNILHDAQAVAADFCQKARDSLAPAPASPSKEALLEIADYIAERRR